MKEFNFENTSIAANYSIELHDNFNFMWVESRTADMYRIFFSTIADVLKLSEDKSYKKIAFKYKNTKGEFIFGAALEFIEPDEDEEDKGNWFLSFTFNEDDLKDADKEIDNHSDLFITCCDHEAESILYGRFVTLEHTDQMLGTLIDVLKKFLDKNASPDEELQVTLRSVFTAGVSIDGDTKIYTITPGEYIKQIIKNDKGL